MELVWVRVFPTDLELVDCLAADLVVLLFKYKHKTKCLSEVEPGGQARGPSSRVLDYASDWPQYTEVH